jgi:hypothetical protein
MNQRKWLITSLFCVILGITSILRITNIADNPPSLSWDEVGIGYNAYSILKTGHDEHGKFLPIDTFVSYGDYKPPLAIYLTVPSIFVFGLNEFGVRFPSALAGIIAVALMFFVTKELLTSVSTKDTSFPFMPFLAMLLFASSPWHVNLSRAGWEANIGLTLLLTGVYLALRARRDPRLICLIPIPFVLSVYTFNSTRYVAPLLAAGLLFYGWNEYKKHIVLGLMACAIGAALMLPIVPHLLSKEARLRFTEVNIFTDQSVVITSNARVVASTNPVTRFFSNRRVGYTMSFVKHFFDHLDASYLFMYGDGNPKFSTRSVGELYMFEAPFIVIGLIALLAGFRSVGLLMLYWLIVSLIPASVARETPHALRTINSLPVWELFSAFGIYTTLVGIWTWSRSIHAKSPSVRAAGAYVFACAVIVIGSIYLVSVVKYVYNYHVHYAKEYAGEWQYGYKQALAAIPHFDTGKEPIFISEKIGRAYMYMLFYTQYDPTRFRNEKKSYFDDAGFYHVTGFGRYVFGTVPEKLPQGSLVILPPEQRPGVTPLETIVMPNGVPILALYRE